MSLLLVTVTLTQWDLEHGGLLLSHFKDEDLKLKGKQRYIFVTWKVAVSLSSEGGTDLWET